MFSTKTRHHEALTNQFNNFSSIEFIFKATNIIEKLIWITISVCGTVWIGSILSIQIIQWKENPVLIRQENLDLTDMTYPAVTFCPQTISEFSIAEGFGNFLDLNKTLPTQAILIQNEAVIRYWRNKMPYVGCNLTWTQSLMSSLANYFEKCCKFRSGYKEKACQNLVEHVYDERKQKNISMSEVHNIATGLNSWNVSAEIFKFVDQNNSNETANNMADYQLINEIRITTDTEELSGCDNCIQIKICQDQTCCTTSSQLGELNLGTTMKILSKSQLLAECATQKLNINSNVPINVTLNHSTTNGWKGKTITIHTPKAYYKCLITKWLDSDDSSVEPIFTTMCEKHSLNVLCFEENIDYLGHDLGSVGPVVATAEDCQIICQQTDQCRYWTHGHPGENYVYSGKCFMKYTKGNVGPLVSVTSGARNCSDACFDIDIDYFGFDIAATASASADDCQKICQQNDQCKYWTFIGGMCHLKNVQTNIGPLTGATSGPKDCGEQVYRSATGIWRQENYKSFDEFTTWTCDYGTPGKEVDLKIYPSGLLFSPEFPNNYKKFGQNLICGWDIKLKENLTVNHQLVLQFLHFDIEEPEEGCVEYRAALTVNTSSGQLSRSCGKNIPESIKATFLESDILEVRFKITEFDKRGGSGFKIAYRFGEFDPGILTDESEIEYLDGLRIMYEEAYSQHREHSDYELIKEIRITTDTVPDAGCHDCLKLKICQGEGCCITPSLGGLVLGTTRSMYGSELGDCATDIIKVNTTLPIDITFNYELNDGKWKGKKAVIFAGTEPYECIITEWIANEENIDSFATKCEVQSKFESYLVEPPKNFGSFMVKLFLILLEENPKSAERVLNEMKSLISLNEIDVDLSSLSNLFTIDNFKNLNLAHHSEDFKHCLEHVLNMTGTSAGDDVLFKDPTHGQVMSPCNTLATNPKCKNYCDWHNDIVTNKLTKEELLSLMRYGLAQKATVLDPIANEDIKLAAKIFGADGIKENLSKITAPNPLIVFCRNYKDQGLNGNKLLGFSSKLCQDFFLSPTHTGICITKGLDVKKIINGPDDEYKKFLEYEKQSSTIKVGKSNYWAVSTFVINALRIDPKKTVIYRTDHKQYGVQLQIHQNKEFAQIWDTKVQDEETKSLTLKPGHEYTIHITPLEQRSTDNFKALSENDRKCKLENELEENSLFQIYTKANCMYECEIEMAYKVCRCIPWDFFHSMKIKGPECDAFGRTCFQDTIDNVTKDDAYCHHCINECDMMKFNLKVHKEEKIISDGNPYINFNLTNGCYGSKSLCEYLLDPNYVLTEKVLSNYSKQAKIIASNLIIVHLKFPSSNVDMTILDARYTWSDQIASFGGIFGIWGELTGITFLGIINICLIIVKLFTCYLQKTIAR